MSVTNPYARYREQEVIPINGEVPDNQGDSAKVITQYDRVVQVYNEGGQWLVKYNNGSAAGVITGGWFDPMFYVRGFKLYVDEQTIFAKMVYDTPKSLQVSDSWATGVVHPGRITRLWTGNTEMTANISISLLG